MSALLSKWWMSGLAATAIVLGRKRRALELYERIVELVPRDSDARSTVGNLKMELGDRRGAIDAFEELLARDARNAGAWFNLGYLYDHGEENAQAERCFKAAVEFDAKLDRAWYGLGLVLIREGRLHEAIAALKRTTKLQPFSPYGFYQLAMTHWHLGESENAWSIQRELSRFEPRFAATLKRDLEHAAPRAGPSATPALVPGSTKEAVTTIH